MRRLVSNKQLWVLAGGNGAGKSTFYRLFLKPAGIKFVNADEISAGLGHSNKDQSYIAAKMAETLRGDLLLKGVSFCFETVFSHPSKIDFMAAAKSRGYELILVFIHLQSDQLNQARVTQRVAEGGHNVPTNKIITRIPRTLKHIQAAIPLANQVQIYDNSSLSQPFFPIAHLQDNQLTEVVEPLPEWASQLLAGYI